MSYDISSISRIAPATPLQRPARPVAPKEPAADTDAVTVDTTPSSPPDEVLSQIATAMHSHDRLLASGHQVHFGIDGQTGAVSIQLQDSGGAVLGTVSPSQVLELAAGGSVT